VAITQTQSGVQLPSPGTYTLDPTHSSVSFSARHLMVSKVRGRFGVTGGTVVVGKNPLESSVEASIDAASVSSGDDKRDAHLRDPDFFDVGQYPTVTFRSTKLEPAKDGEYHLHGDLTIKDVTRPVVLDLEYLGTATAPWGATSIGFTATTVVNRKDWGLEWNVALESGGFVVGDKITLTIDAEAIRQ